MALKTPLYQLPSIGPGYDKRLERLNLFTVEDLITHYPFRYDDFSVVSSAMDAQIDQKVTLRGEIWSIKNVYTRSRKVLTQAIFNDGTTPIILTWFNSSWLIKQIRVGDKLQISGKLTKYKNKLSIMAPSWEKSAHIQGVVGRHTGRLVPIYPETYGVSSKWFRTKISQILPKIKIQDSLPSEILDSMLPLEEALNKIHFPDSWHDVEKARERLGFDELFYVQLATLKVRQDWQKKVAVDTFEVDRQKFIETLPFKLTNAQKRVLQEISADLKKGYAMNRLVQGEVGSGKTVVAAIAAYITHQNKLKTLYMAPTEILAFQHFETLSRLLPGIKIGIYTGSKKRIKDADVFVGTHALLSDKLVADDVGLVIIDEQQRFGVEQRSLLRSKAKGLPAGRQVPHFLTMTATPIPRTVALTVYGDLDLSIIDEMPVGRKRVKTYVVPNQKRKDAYGFIAKKVGEGDQVYIITPLIEQSETLQSVKAAKVEFEHLKDIFPHLKLGLLHGRLKSKEKEEVIRQFRDRATQILVSTSVIEVGMDMPNATVMVIEGAERFGLAQLHQLRGRVGRGEKESFCLLFSEDPNALSRLKNLEKLYDGLKLAELDLKIRGGGEIFGIKQAGRFEFKIAGLSDLTLIEKVRVAAGKILQQDPTLDKYPKLKARLENLGKDVMPD